MPLSNMTLRHLADALHANALTRAQRRALAEDTRAGARALWARHLAARSREAAEQRRLRRMQQFERPLWDAGVVHVAGVDEVGVGPLAGPVVAAAVVLPPRWRLVGLNDSKQVPRARREALDAAIRGAALGVGLGRCSVAEIDAFNIYAAAREAARRALVALGCPCEHILVDAHRIPAVRPPQTAIEHGDALSHSIAAASIVAKVARDALMVRLDAEHPGYGLAQHMGYGTAAHLEALARLGPSRVHRRSFAPVRMAAVRFGGA